MSRTYTNWKNPKTLELVKKAVQANPDNLRKAFEKASMELNCSATSISQQWYKKLSKDFEPLFATESNKVVKVNGKNSPRRETVNQPIHEMIISSKIVDGIKIVTTKQFFVV